jgi:Bacterial PH domain
MRPSQDQPGELVRAEPGRAVPIPNAPDGAGLMPRPAAAPAVVAPVTGTPAELSGMLLPTEAVTFASSPHPIIFVRPVLQALLILLALGIVMSLHTHPVVRGHHVSVPLITGVLRTVVPVIGMLLVLREAVSLVGRLFHFLAYRVVTTNRRVFVVQGLFGRRVTPLGNTALAGATMSQGLLGRMLGFGNIFLTSGAIRDMRDPVRLYRELEAVALGVDGDTWTQPIRQTIIP